MSTSSRFVAKNGLDNNGKTIVNLAEPVNAQDAATKNYFTARGISTTSGFPSISPTLNLDFTNGTQIDPRITFTRASTGTYSSNQTAMAEQNLLTYSQDFTNAAWAKGALSALVANATVAPDGTTTATTLTDNTTVGTYHYLASAVTTVAATTYTFSCYAKNLDGQYVNLTFNHGASMNNGSGAIYDLVNGTVTYSSSQGSGWSITSTSITSVGSGWYRCTLTFVAGLTATVYATIARSNVSTGPFGPYVSVAYTGTNQSVYIWGAQLEQRSSLTAYTPTTTSAVTNYINIIKTASANVPRLEYDSTTRMCKGLLIEESRTNLLTYSQDFSNVAWTKNNCTITSGAIIAPDGTLTGSKMVETANSAVHNLRTTLTLTSGTNQTFSFYVKSSITNSLCSNIILTRGFGTNASESTFNLSTGAVTTNLGTGNASMINVGNNWWKCSCSFPATLLSSATISIDLNSATSYVGDGVSGIYIWGAQLEQGSSATSYIPTTTTAVTRAADDASITGTNFSSWFNQSSGSFSIDASVSILQSSFLTLTDGTDTNRIQATVTTNAGTQARVFVYKNSVLQGDVYSTAVIGSTKMAYIYSSGTHSLSSAGNAATTGTLIGIPVVSMLRIGSYNGGGVSNILRSIKYYPKALTSTELQTLTS